MRDVKKEEEDDENNKNNKTGRATKLTWRARLVEFGNVHFGCMFACHVCGCNSCFNSFNFDNIIVMLLLDLDYLKMYEAQYCA